MSDPEQGAQEPNDRTVALGFWVIIHAIMHPLGRVEMACKHRMVTEHAELLQLAHLSDQAESLTARSEALKSAGQRVCDALHVLAREEKGLADALDTFCSGTDVESIQIGCPMLKRFVPLLERNSDEQTNLGQLVQTLLVTSVDIDLGKYLKQIRDNQKVLLRVESSDSGRKFRIPLAGKPADDRPPSQVKREVEDARLDLAYSVNAWERHKEHFFLGNFMDLSLGLATYFEHGSKQVSDMHGILEDLRRTRQASLLREVRFCRSCGWWRNHCMGA
jgi:hypothetical protein